MPDMYDEFTRHDQEDQKWLDSRPVCDYCGQPIQSEDYWNVDGTLYCADCMESFRRSTDDWEDDL